MKITSPNETDDSPNIGETGIPNTGKTLFQLLKQSYQKGFAASQESLSNKEVVPETITDTIPIKDNDAFYTKVSSRQTATVRTKDSTTTLLAKLLNLFIAIQDEKKKEKELKHNFAKEKNEKLLKQHIEIVEAFGGKSKFSKVEKKKRKGTGILGKLLLGSSLFAFSDMVMANTKDVTEKAKGFSSELGSGLEKLWTIAKDEIDKFEIIKNIEEFTAPMMNWLHDRLSSIFGETAVNMVFKKRPEQVDKLTAESAEMVSSLFPEIEPPKMSSGKKDMMKKVFNSFKKAGFSDNQAIALTSEVGRENDFEEKHIFGAHKDAANAAVNVGFFSWQGDRKEKLMSFMEAKGLLDEGGSITHTQESLDAMAEFSKNELSSGPYNIGDFLENKNVDSEVAAKQLGKGYIKWAMGQSILKNGQSFDSQAHDARRRAYSNVLKEELSSKKLNQPEQSPYVSTLGDGLDKASVENKDIKKINRQDNNTVIVNNNNFQYLNPTTKNTSIMYKQNDNSQLSNWSIN